MNDISYTQQQVQQLLLMANEVFNKRMPNTHQCYVPEKLDNRIKEIIPPSDDDGGSEMRVRLDINGIPTIIRGNTLKELVENALSHAQVSSDTTATIIEENNHLPRTFKEYAEHYLNHYKNGKKSGTYIKELHGYLNNYLIPAFGSTRLCNIRTCDIQQMLDSITSMRFPGQELGKKTKSDILAFMSMILDSAIEDEIIKVNPAKSKRISVGGKPEREVPSWSEADWAILFKQVVPSLRYQQDRLFLLIDMFHGLRKCEIAALKWSDIDLKAGTLSVTSSVQWATKTGGGNQGNIKEPKTRNGKREITLSEYIIPYLKQADKTRPYLIYGTRAEAKLGDKPPSFSVLESIISRIRAACQVCGLQQVYRTHELRHTVVTFDCNAEIDDKTLANNHGHFTAEFSKKQYARSLSTQWVRARRKSDQFMGNILEALSVEECQSQCQKNR